MKTKAAIAHAAGRPLEVVTVDLDGPKAGEVLVEIRASGVCHTDEFTRSGGDPEGLFPVIFGHEGAGVGVDVGPGMDHHARTPVAGGHREEDRKSTRLNSSHRSSSYAVSCLTKKRWVSAP